MVRLLSVDYTDYACILKKPEKINQEFVELSIENFKLQDPIENCLNNIKVLPLETDTNCLMGYIEKIEICEPYILVLDVNHTLFVYRMDGMTVAYDCDQSNDKVCAVCNRYKV